MGRVRAQPHALPLLAAGAALFGLVAVLYRSVLPWWVSDLWHGPNYSHGLLIPFVSAWLVYERRGRLAALQPEGATSAIVIILGALLLFVAGLLGAELFTTRVSMLLLLTGVLGFVLGYGYVRVLALPLAFLLFMVPLPAVLFNAIAFPLQLLASQLAISSLHGIGVPALREGNVILLPNGALEVAEACSGLRSLISLAATGVLVGVLMLRRNSLRLIIAISSIPIAVLSNGLRVSGTGVLAYHFGPSVAEGFFHGFSGWVVFVAALACLGAETLALRRFDGT